MYPVNRPFFTVRATVLSTALVVSVAQAKERHDIFMKSNSTLHTVVSIPTVKQLSALWEATTIHQRLRSNTFSYQWQSDTQDSHTISGLGYSLMIQTPRFNGFDAKVVGHATTAFVDTALDDITTLKAGKDTLSRYNYLTYGTKHMALFSEAYIGYGFNAKHRIQLGRQIVESFYAKSNDTKMVPNTFEGIVYQGKITNALKLQAGYLTQQKLRDHTTSHAILAYGDSNYTNSSYANYTLNDDSAMHKGLTYTALQQAGVEVTSPLLLADVSYQHTKSKVDMAYYEVPALVRSIMLEVNQGFDVAGIHIAPGIRYIRQSDLGAGRIGGAALDTDTTGYMKPQTIEAEMVAARVVAKQQGYKLNMGYTQVLNQADLIAPWRAFPTAGYTRSMARYNWKANMKSYRVELVKSTSKIGDYRDGFMQLSVLYTDADEAKNDADERFYYAGYVKNLHHVPNVQYRVRLGYTDSEAVDKDGLDGRFEVNYFF